MLGKPFVFRGVNLARLKAIVCGAQSCLAQENGNIKFPPQKQTVCPTSFISTMHFVQRGLSQNGETRAYLTTHNSYPGKLTTKMKINENIQS